MNISDIRTQRMQNQRLIGGPFGRPPEVVRWQGAVQAQDYPGAKWGLALRCGDMTDATIEQAINDGDILRTHMMRPTWHFVMPEDIRWIQALTAHRVHATSKSRYRDLEIDDAVATQAMEHFTAALVGGHFLTRPELREVLQRGGIRTDGQRLAYLVMWAELEAVICSGPRRGKQFTYALLDERVPPGETLDPDEALVELTRRYFQSHGPATPHGFAWWSGLTVKDARRGIAFLGDELASETIDEATWWFVPPASIPAIFPTPLIHLLPNFDEYFIGFRNHTPTFEPAVRAQYDGNREHWAANMIARNGIIIGRWRRTLSSRAVTVSRLSPAHLDAASENALAAACVDYGRFLDLPVTREAP